MAGKSILETKQVRYLLGLSSPAEREHIESEYFENDEAFQEMLTTEDDLIDAYSRGELASGERRRFEKSFVSSLRGRDRVQFARAFTSAVTQPIETKGPGILLDTFKTFQSFGLLRTAMIAMVIVFVAVLAWLVSDRRSMINELRELRAESAELNKRTEALQRSSNNERTRTADIAAQLADLRAHRDKPRHPERRTTATHRARILPEVKNDREKIAGSKTEPKETSINTQDASLGNTFERRKITELLLDTRNVANPLTLQPAGTRNDKIAEGRADQTGVTLDGVDISEPLNIHPLMPQNMSSSGGTTLRGTAKDPNGNVVSDATVTLTGAARNFTRTQSTNKDGVYVFTAIPAGTYSIKIEARGFKAASVSGLAALVDTPICLDVQLEFGNVSETVSVTAGAAEALVNRVDGTLGNHFETKLITKLPLNAKDVVGLLSLQPGVTRTGFVNSGRADQSTITLDGADTTIRIPSFLTWIKFQIPLATAAIYEDYRLTIKTANGRPVTYVDWIEPLEPNQTIIDTPVILRDDLASGDYVLLLMGKKADGSFVKVAECSFKVIKY